MLILIRFLWWCSLLLSIFAIVFIVGVLRLLDSDDLGNGVIFPFAAAVIPAALAPLLAFVVLSIVRICLKLSPPRDEENPDQDRSDLDL